MEQETAIDKFNGLTEGRIVHFVLPNGQHRPAIVVRVWDKEHVNGCSQLTVFTDWQNDFRVVPDGTHGIVWRTSVLFDEKCEPGTWHWIERA